MERKAIIVVYSGRRSENLLEWQGTKGGGSHDPLDQSGWTILLWLPVQAGVPLKGNKGELTWHESTRPLIS